MSKKLHWITKKVKVSDLLQLDINPRKISEEKKQKLIESLERFNLVEIPAVNTNMQIIGGNQRVAALLLAGRGDEEIDVRYPSRKLTDKELKEYAIISNTHAGEFDFEVLDLEFADIPIDDLGFEIPGWDDWKNKQDKILAQEAQEDDFDVPAGGIETDIVPGDLFEIGQHRLLCGDSTDSDAVARLMDGQKADMVFTDPPYGVDYKGIKNDDRAGLKDLLDGAFSNYKINSKSGASVYCCHSDKCSDIFNEVFRTYCHFSCQIIWVKDSLVMSRGDYHSKHEPIFYGWMEGGSHKFEGDRKQTTVWEFERPKKSEGHSTMKPVGLVAKGITNSSKSEDLILDLFIGGGSTMVAAHQLNRRCYGMELDPKYCQVIINRMLKLDPTLKILKNGKEWHTQKAS